MLRAERQSARVSKITNDGLSRSDTGFFLAVPITATVGVKGLTFNIVDQLIQATDRQTRGLTNDDECPAAKRQTRHTGGVTGEGLGVLPTF